MNYMKQIATDILGLYWNDEKNESEEFKIINDNEPIEGKYKITQNGCVKDMRGLTKDIYFLKYLLNGDFEIEKIPWKPKEDERYYLVNENGDINSYENNYALWDACLIKCGWAFRTKEEAEANKERVLKEMREVLDE